MKQRGFTIVELVVSIVVITVIAGIVTAVYNGVQKSSRDSVRESNVFVISQGLEKYYDNNGEYPSVRNLVNSYAGNTGMAVGAILDIQPTTLKMPLATSSTTNSLTSSDPPTNDGITYVGYSSTNNTNCQSSTTGGCTRYTLKYIKEQTGAVSVNSKRGF